MGLDSVELIMEFEKAFEIRIPDQEAEKLRTVGEVHNYIWNRLDYQKTLSKQMAKLTMSFQKKIEEKSIEILKKGFNYNSHHLNLQKPGIIF